MSDFSGNRTVCIKCRITQEEYAYIMQKLQCSGCSTMSDYLRKMAITGMIIRYDSALLKDLQQSLQRIGNNVNQIAIRVNQSGILYKEDFVELQERYEEIWRSLKSIQSVLRCQKQLPTS